MTAGSNIEKRKNYVIKKIIISFSFAIVIVCFYFFVLLPLKNEYKKLPSVSYLHEKWRVYDYEAVYDMSRRLLDTHPFNNTALTYHGYSSFFLAVSQLDSSLAQVYLDESINSLRIALYNARYTLIPQLEYMLGKAYFYKNTITSYYYADSAVKYLMLAKKHGYKADDIAEYLGLSYAALGLTMESISSFTEALLVRESDSLLLSIAEQYYKSGQLAVARQYLFRIKNQCNDDDLVLKTMNLLGTIYSEEGNYDEAKNEFESILKKNQKSADAYYGLGNVYEKQGNLVKARAEWRKALRVQVNHPGALAKIADYK